MSAHQLSWRSGTSFWQRGVDPRSLAQREAALGTIAPPNNPAAISEGCANESRFHQLSIIDGRHSRRPFSREIIDGMSLAAYLPRFTQGYRIRSRSNSPNRPRQLPNPIDYLGKSAIDYRGHAQASALVQNVAEARPLLKHLFCRIAPHALFCRTSKASRVSR